ncbi:inovirus Gp2 family protein [Photobacterium sp. SDRW27]|uniref:inovirus Gp2 family protein n=1 Tax=Photobacterium obscurum TaxID=2829490 RepID=UPI00224362F0|nr:inovirus Gp2 family protein [Photobacterium obscurum]MCW8331950.1 inovirus Gp2 family protein [Photobacterium obscurum]
MINQNNYQCCNISKIILEHYEGMKVQTGCGPLKLSYLQAIKKTLDLSLSSHPKTCAMRFDLRYPADSNNQIVDSKHISRFIDSFKAILAADLNRKGKSGRCIPRFVWVKEQKSSERPHYHVVLLVNGNIYNQLGWFTKNHGNMAARIQQAWASALSIPMCDVDGTVHYPNNPIYIVNKYKSDFQDCYEELFYRLSYFAKENTKHYGTGKKNFGSSRK